MVVAIAFFVAHAQLGGLPATGSFEERMGSFFENLKDSEFEKQKL